MSELMTEFGIANDELKEDEADLVSDIEDEDEDDLDDDEDDDDDDEDGGKSHHDTTASGSMSESEDDNNAEAQLLYIRQEMVCNDIYTVFIWMSSADSYIVFVIFRMREHRIFRKLS